MASIETINLTDCAVVRNVYNSVDSQEISKQQLNSALKAGYKYIVIEPTQLGNHIVMCIGVCHYLSKTAIVSGLMSIGTAFFWSSKPLVYGYLSMASFVSTGLYISWQFNPCVKYHVHKAYLNQKYCQKEENIPQLPLIIKRDSDTKRKLVHTSVCSVSLASTVYCIWKLYECFK